MNFPMGLFFKKEHLSHLAYAFMSLFVFFLYRTFFQNRKKKGDGLLSRPYLGTNSNIIRKSSFGLFLSPL
jgi:hypothetical protein